jgi:hypothetical protein
VEKIEILLIHGCKTLYMPVIFLVTLYGALLSLAAFTNDLCILKIMRGHWFCGDSLIQNDLFWNNLNKDGFDAVIGNLLGEK